MTTGIAIGIVALVALVLGVRAWRRHALLLDARRLHGHAYETDAIANDLAMAAARAQKYAPEEVAPAIAEAEDANDRANAALEAFRAVDPEGAAAFEAIDAKGGGR